MTTTRTTTKNYRYRTAGLRQVPASDREEELRPVEVPREPRARRALPCGRIGRQTLHRSRRLAALAERADTSAFLPTLADKYCGGYLRFTSRNNVEFLLTDSANIEPLKADLTQLGFPVGRHQQRDQQHCAHPGLGALPLGGDRCFGAGEVRDGCALRPLHGRESARQAADRRGLLPQYVRRRALLRHRHSGRPSHTAEDPARPCCPRSARSQR